MPWGRLDDGLYDHPKLDSLGRDRLAGVGLLTLAVSWSNRRLTDGYIPAERVVLLGGSLKLADKLVAAGMFDRAHDGGYLVHDFLDYNDSRSDVEARRAADADRKRRVRQGVQPESTSESVPESTAESARTPDGPRARAHDRARPGPAYTDSDREKVPSTLSPRASSDAGTSHRNGTTTISAEDQERWSDFGSEWSAVKAAWIERGLSRPPTPEQRAVLWEVLDARPTDLVRWIAGAPKGARTGSAVVSHVIGQWRAISDGVEEEQHHDEPSKTEAARALTDILAGM